MSSVRLSPTFLVPSAASTMFVTVLDQDHIGWKSWKLIARTISPTPLLFVAQRPFTYSQGNMVKLWGRSSRLLMTDEEIAWE